MKKTNGKKTTSVATQSPTLVIAKRFQYGDPNTIQLKSDAEMNSGVMAMSVEVRNEIKRLVSAKSSKYHKMMSLVQEVDIAGKWVRVIFVRGTPRDTMVKVRNYLSERFVFADKDYEWSGPLMKNMFIAIGPRSKSFRGYTPGGASSGYYSIKII